MTSTLTEKKDVPEAKPKTDLARDPLQTMGFPSLSRMRREFDELLGKFFTEVPALWNAERGDGRWAFDVEDQPDAYLIKAEAPGFESKDFNINLRGNQLVLQAKRHEEKKDKGKETFTSSEFYHAMSIPQYVDAEKIAATYKHGILQVTLPKTADGKGRQIQVKS
jgi:HSP20 family protein